MKDAVDWNTLLYETWISLSKFSEKSVPEIKRVELRFYPYRNGSSSLLWKKGILSGKIHESFLAADRTTAESLAKLLISRILGRAENSDWKESVQNYLNRQSYKPRRTKIYSPLGKHYDLERVFSRIRSLYFERDDLEGVRIEWSPRMGKRRLGTYDRETKTVRISPVLDRPEVPEFVIDHIVHHEILHHLYPVLRWKNRNVIHGPEFKKKEREFERFREANRWLKTVYPKMAALSLIPES